MKNEFRFRLSIDNVDSYDYNKLTPSSSMSSNYTDKDDGYSVRLVRDA